MERPTRIVKQNTVPYKPPAYKSFEEKPCKYGRHTWNGVIPTVDENKHEIQNRELIGTECDCKKIIYHGEQTCSCGTRKWRIEFMQNYNYGK